MLKRLSPVCLMSLAAILQAGCAGPTPHERFVARQNQAVAEQSRTMQELLHGGSAVQTPDQCPWPDTTGYSRTDEKYTLSAMVMAARLLRKPTPGCVVMSFSINLLGKATNVRILGGEQGPLLDSSRKVLGRVNFDAGLHGRDMLFRLSAVHKTTPAATGWVVSVQFW